LNKFVYSLEFFESIVAFKIDRSLSSLKNKVIYTDGENLNAKDFAHLHDQNIPGSNTTVVRIKNLLKSSRARFKYLVFKINEQILKKYFK
jgi:hypothetical protein